MEMLDYDTRLFKNIFPNYQSFKDYYLSTPLSYTDAPTEKTFAIIAFEFNDSHSAFSVESFKQHFALDIYTFYREFEKTTDAITELMKLTDDEIATENVMITNVANIPENESSTDEETVDFISNQQKSISKKGKLQIKREQLANKRIFTVRTFLNRFRHLFVKVISPAYTFVIREDWED